MKIKRIVAALLSILTVASVMSVTFAASAEESNYLFMQLASKSALWDEHCTRTNNVYDSKNDVVYTSNTPDKAKDKIPYINVCLTKGNVTFAEGITFALYCRTNSFNGKAYSRIFQAFKADGKTEAAPVYVYAEENTNPNGEWQTVYFSFTKENITAYHGESNYPQTAIDKLSTNGLYQIGFYLMGNQKKANELCNEDGTTDVYEDVAALGVFSSLTEAKAFDFASAVAAPKVELTFDAQNGKDAIVKNVTSGKYNTGKVEFPEVVAPNDMELAYWATSADGKGSVDHENLDVPTTNTTYYAIWQAEGTGTVLSLSALEINKTTADKYGVSDFTDVDEITVKLPYGWEKLEKLGVMPEIVPTAAVGTAEYIAPAKLSENGKIKVINGNNSREITVKFEVAKNPGNKIATIPGVGVAGSSSYVKDGGTVTVSRGLGVTHAQVDAHEIEKVQEIIPVYSSRTDVIGTVATGTKADTYTDQRSVAMEGTFPGHDFETYEAYRFLVYYDTGANGKFDIGDSVTPAFAERNYSGSYTGTFHEKLGGNGVDFVAATGALKGNRWEYVYFVKPDSAANLYGKVAQQHYYLMGSGKSGKDYTDDKIYVAEFVGLTDVEEFMQYKPVDLVKTDVTETSKGLGTISGLNADMEYSVDGGEKWFHSPTDCELVLPAGTYLVRYAATGSLLASEAVEIKIAPLCYDIKFDPQNGSDVTVTQPKPGEAVVAPAGNPQKSGFVFGGWAETADGTTAVDFTGVKATEAKTYYAIWNKIDKVFLDGSSQTNGNGLTAETAMNNFTEAWNTVKDNGGTIVITGDVPFAQNLALGNGDVVITNKDGATTYNGKLIFGYPITLQTSAEATGKIKFENITIAQEHSYNGTNKNEYRYLNFSGAEVEFGEGITVVEADDSKYTTLKMRMGGESTANHFGRKVIIRSGKWGQLFLGGKKGADKPFDIDFEYYGGTGTIYVGNDIVESISEEAKYYTYGAIGNAKLLFDAKPSKIEFSNISAINGNFAVIANNGVELNMPGFSFTNNKDVTTNTDSSKFTADLTPAGGYWRINSSANGRADFTDAADEFKFTTAKTYVVITDNDGNTSKYRVSDGKSDAELYADEASVVIKLEAGVYNVDYTDEGVGVDVLFRCKDAEKKVTLNKENNYTATVISSDNVYADAPEGQKFSGEFASEDGKYKTVNGSVTITEYSKDEILLLPVYVEDDTKPYYHLNGEWDKLNSTYTLKVSIANGKFNGGTLGIFYDKNFLALNNYAYNDAGGVAESLLGEDELPILKLNESGTIVLQWYAKEGVIDATQDDVEIVTFTFTLSNSSYVGPDDLIWVTWNTITVYEGCFDGKNCLVAVPSENDRYDVKYEKVYYGDLISTEKSAQKANITFNITLPEKSGATKKNIGYIVISGKNETKTYTFDDVDNTEKEITKVINDFFRVGETVSVSVLKNGYVGAIKDGVVLSENTTVSVELIAGDIKNAKDEKCGDGKVTLSDFVRVIRAFDENADEDFKNNVNINEDAETDGSAIINVEDLAIVKKNYGKKTDSVTFNISAGN